MIFMRLVAIYCFLVFVFIISSNSLLSQQVETVIDGKKISLYKHSYALVIGFSKYNKSWRELPGVKKDIDTVSKVLEKHGFEVHQFEDLNSNEFKFAIIDFINKYGLDPNNRLLFYFAGHGYTVSKSYGEEMGYLVPIDAPDPREDREGFLSKALPMLEFEIFARMIDSKHALFLFDACFSGNVFDITRSIYEPLTEKVSEPVRQFISAGSANETVPDNSIFCQQFIEAISGSADANKDSLISTSELSAYLYKMVTFYSYDTEHPQYGKIRNPKLDKGDFLFKIVNLANKPLIVEKKPEEIIIQLDYCHVEMLSTFSHDEAQNLVEALVNEGFKNIFIQSVEDTKYKKTRYIVRSISFPNTQDAVSFRGSPAFKKAEIWKLMLGIPAQIKCDKKSKN
jgi:uncharacterized caspase-like protein